MRSLEAAMQAIVFQGPITVAVAWLLVQHSRDRRRHLIGDNLVWMSEVDASQLVTAQYCW